MNSHNRSNSMKVQVKEELERFYNMPSTTRQFPSTIESLLALRSSMRQYKLNGGRIMSSEESPETDGEGLSDGRMYAMCICPPIVSHAVVVNENMCVCEAVYGDVPSSDIAATIRSMIKYMESHKWLISNNNEFAKPVAVMNLNSNLMVRASMVYQSVAPLCAYNNHAVSEALNHSMNSTFWTNMYPILEHVQCHYGFYGLIHDNTVISLGDVAGSDTEPNIEERIPKADHGGFLDACFTPQSKASGKVRVLAAGVSLRIMTKRTIEIASEMLSVLRFGNGIGLRDWVVRCMGICCIATEKDVRSIVNKWKTYCEINMPTVHVFREAKVLVISVATGTLIRPMRLKMISNQLVNEGPFVDSVSVHNSDTMRFASLSFPKREDEPHQYLNIGFWTIPFGAWTADPRLNLGIQMLRQAMSMSPISGDATVVSHGETPTLIKTPLTDLLMQHSKDTKLISMPGTHVVTAFVNRYLNMEDGCSVSKEWAESGALTWSGYINYPLPQDEGNVKIGMSTKDRYWWKPAIDGTVVDVRTSKVGDPHVVVHVGSKKLEIGDKLGVAHGLKFTVGEIIPLADMPRIKNEETGEVVIPNLLLSTKNLTRGLGGVIREMAAITNLFPSIESFRTWTGPKPMKTYTFEDEKKIEAKLPNGVLMMHDTPLTFVDGKMGKRTVKTSYGILRVLQLRHISALKQHYPSMVYKSIAVPRGRYRQGTPRLSEGELISMMMQNCPSSVRDALLSDGMVSADWCGSCNRLGNGCDCPAPKPEKSKIMLRYADVLLDQFSTVAMLNTPDKKRIGMRFFTQT